MLFGVPFTFVGGGDDQVNVVNLVVAFVIRGVGEEGWVVVDSVF